MCGWCARCRRTPRSSAKQRSESVMKRRALLALLIFTGGCQKAAPEPLRVAAAADLAHAFAELSPSFSAQSAPPTELKLSLGATGLLARQLEQGAPFDLFLAANVSYVDQV